MSHNTDFDDFYNRNVVRSLLAPLLVGILIYLGYLCAVCWHLWRTGGRYNSLCIYYVTMPLHLLLRAFYFFIVLVVMDERAYVVFQTIPTLCFYISVSLMSLRWSKLETEVSNSRYRWKPDYQQILACAVNVALYALIYILEASLPHMSEPFWTVYYFYNCITLFLLTLANAVSGCRLYHLHKT